MRRRWLLPVLAVIAALTTSCSNPGRFGVYNNTGETLVLHISALVFDAKMKRKIVRPSHWMWAYIQQFPAEEEMRTLRVSAGRCELVYKFWKTGVPLPDDVYPDHYGHPVLQIEPDFAVYLRPHDVEGAVPRQELRAATFGGKPLQRGLFPLIPAEKTCR